jgi:hypothetical protein
VTDIHVHQGDPTQFHPRAEHPTVIYIDRTLPEDMSTNEWRATAAQDGAAIAVALWESLPGATVDEVLAGLLAHRASALRVRFPTDLMY